MQTAGDKGVHLQGQPGAGPGKTFRGSVGGSVRGAPAFRQDPLLRGGSSRAPGCVTRRRGATESQLLDRLGESARTNRTCRPSLMLGSTPRRA